MLFVDPDGRDNVIYLVATDKDSRKQLKAIAAAANANFAKNGLKIEVKIFKGNFDKKAYESLAKTDAVAVIGKRDDVINKVKDFNSGFAQELKDGDFGHNSGEINPEYSADPSSNNTNIIAIGSEATETTAKSANSTFTEVAGYSIFHGAGHNSGMKHAAERNGRDENGNYNPTIIVPNSPNIMTALPIAMRNIQAGSATLQTYITSPVNTQPAGVSASGSPTLSIQRMYQKRFASPQAEPKLPTTSQ
jgi:hypothetical protein